VFHVRRFGYTGIAYLLISFILLAAAANWAKLLSILAMGCSMHDDYDKGMIEDVWVICDVKGVIE